MGEEKIKGSHLEEVLFSLLDYQAKQGTSHDDAMLMLALLNLLGIVSLMNKQAGNPAVSQYAAAELNPMLNTLLQMMAGRPEGPAGQQPGQPSGPEQKAPSLPFNPAMLTAFLNQQPGQKPDPGLLLSLLGSVLGGQGPPASGRPPAAPATMEPKKTVSPPASSPAGGGEAKQKIVKWGAQLDKEKRA